MDLQLAVKTFIGKFSSDVIKCLAIPANFRIQTQAKQVHHYASIYSFGIYNYLLKVGQKTRKRHSYTTSTLTQKAVPRMYPGVLATHYHKHKLVEETCYTLIHITMMFLNR